MNQSYTEWLEVVRQSAKSADLDTMTEIAEGKQNWIQEAQILLNSYMLPMSFVDMNAEVQKEKALFEFNPKNWEKIYDPNTKKWKWRYGGNK